MYVIELLRSPLPIDPNKIPQLDLYPLYHLYTDARLQFGFTQHSLRLGFFNEARAANAIARYLGSYFSAVRVAQIDPDELARSLKRQFRPLRDIGASGTHEAIELVAPRPLPAETHAAPSDRRVTDAIPARSLWSRFFDHLTGRVKQPTGAGTRGQ